MSTLFKKLACALYLLAALCSNVFAYTDTDLIAIRDGFGARRNSMLDSQISSPYPDQASTSNYVWNREDFALAALYRNRSQSEINAANQAILDACAAQKADTTDYDTSFHWHGNLFFRIYKYFGHDAPDANFRGRLTPAAEAAICDVFWNWAKYKSLVSDAEIQKSKTWYVGGSENHSTMHNSTSYSAAAILKDVAPYNTYLYDDHCTAQQHYDAWNKFYKEYFRERAKRGLLVEIGSPTYSKYSLQGWYNFYDFAEDPELAKLAGLTIDLWWADWAHDEINGVRGGGRARVYQDGSDLYAINDAAYAMCWYYLNIGTANNKHPGIMCMATTKHRLPLVVIDLAMDISGRGTYEFKSRRPALNLIPRPADAPPSIPGWPMYCLDPNYGGIYRYTYTTPGFVIGSSMLENRAESDWSAISDQNRWQGVIFKANADARIVPQCVGTDSSHRNNNQSWSVQNKGTLIAQKLSTSTNTGDMRVYISRSYFSSLSEESGWVFVNTSDSYAAVRPASGTYTWDDSNWMHLSDSYAAVIIEVAKAGDFASFTAFKTAVKALPLAINSGVLTYTGLGSNGAFTFYTTTSQLPKINGQTINLKPTYTFDSPFMHEDWATGIVTISKSGRSETLNFNESGCGALPYNSMDFNKDCVVDFKDAQTFAASWLYTNALDSGSNNYPNLVEAKWPDTGNYNIPRATVVPTIDGTISTGEWMDARPIEMIYPTLTTSPNRGTVRSGTTAPTSNADYSLFWYVKWDPNYLYIAGVVYDDDNNTNAGLDEPQVIFNYQNITSHVWLTSAFCINFAHNGILNSNGGPALSHCAMSRQDLSGKSVIEAKFKWSDIDLGAGYTPAIGDKHGFGFFCQDHNLSGTRVHALCDYDCNAGLNKPAYFNTITLVNTFGCDDTHHSDLDFDNNCIVDMHDFAVFAANWLACTDPSNTVCTMDF